MGTTTITNKTTRFVAVAVTGALAATLLMAGASSAEAKTVKKPAKVAKPSVSSVKANGFKVTWKKAKRAKGYQVKVSKGSKTVKTYKVTSRSKVVTGLKSSTTYKVKVRAYAKSGKKVKWGKWSTAKSVTTRKSSTASASTSGTSSTKSCDHDWQLYKNPGVSGEVRIYYCLGQDWSEAYCNNNPSSCTEFFPAKTSEESLALLKAHEEKTGHTQVWPGIGFVYRDGIKTRVADLPDGEPAYSYVTAKNFKTLGTQLDRCSECGATRVHQHDWNNTDKRVVSDGGYKVVAYTVACTYCAVLKKKAGETDVSKWKWNDFNVGWWDTPIGEDNALEKHDLETGHSGSSHGVWGEQTTISKYIWSDFTHRTCKDCGLNVYVNDNGSKPVDYDLG